MSMIPGHLAAEYWDDVKEVLQRRHGLTATQAGTAVSQFQDEALPKTGDMIYHAEAEATASTVKAWIESKPAQTAARTA